MRKPDEIMAEYLLKGGKMLAKTCSSCSSPLFEYKGETLCVVCKEESEDLKKDNSDQTRSQTPDRSPEIPKYSLKTKRELTGNLDDEFALTIGSLLRQAREETDLQRIKNLMKAIKTAAKAYAILSH